METAEFCVDRHAATNKTMRMICVTHMHGIFFATVIRAQYKGVTATQSDIPPEKMALKSTVLDKPT